MQQSQVRPVAVSTGVPRPASPGGSGMRPMPPGWQAPQGIAPGGFNNQAGPSGMQNQGAPRPIIGTIPPGGLVGMAPQGAQRPNPGVLPRGGSQVLQAGFGVGGHGTSISGPIPGRGPSPVPAISTNVPPSVMRPSSPVTAPTQPPVGVTAFRPPMAPGQNGSSFQAPPLRQQQPTASLPNMQRPPSPMMQQAPPPMTPQLRPPPSAGNPPPRPPFSAAPTGQRPPSPVGLQPNQQMVRPGSPSMPMRGPIQSMGHLPFQQQIPPRGGPLSLNAGPQQMAPKGRGPPGSANALSGAPPLQGISGGQTGITTLAPPGSVNSHVVRPPQMQSGPLPPRPMGVLPPRPAMIPQPPGARPMANGILAGNPSAASPLIGASSGMPMGMGPRNGMPMANTGMGVAGGAPASVPGITRTQNSTPQQQPRGNLRPLMVDVWSPSSVPIAMQSAGVDQTNSLMPFPPASTNYACLDTGQASCRFIRPTSRFIPTSSSLVEELKFPLALACTPFAEPKNGETGVPLSEWVHETGPIRCSRCKGYINCFIRASPDLARWECSLCSYDNETPSHYRSFALGTALPELRFGSVDFDVPQIFFGERAQARSNYLFVVDATAISIRSGLFGLSLRTVLQLVKARSFVGGDTVRVGIITFDETSVYFFETIGDGRRPNVLVNNDCDEGFSPLPSSAFLIPQTEPRRFEDLVQFISMQQGGTDGTLPQVGQENISGAAMMSGLAALAHEGGRMILLTASICNKGAGRLGNREQPPLVGTDQEQILYLADKEEQFYNDFSLKCLQSSVAVDIFVCGAEFIDAAAVVQVSSTTGGGFGRIPHFQAANALHRQEFELLLLKVASSTRALSLMMKARTSNGLRVGKHLAHGFPEESSFRAAAMSTDSCMVLELEHDGTKLEDGKSRAVVQFAVLYVDTTGKRRLRVHNIALQAKESPMVLMSSLDPIAVALYQAKLASLELADMSVNKCRDQMVKRLCDWTKAMNKYRPPPSHLKPEPFDLITLFVNSLFKSPALLLNRPLDRGVREPYARADARIASRFRFLAIPPELFALTVYPALIDLTVEPFVRLPASSEFLRPEGIFLLIEASETAFLFVGARADPMKVEQVLGVVPAPDNRVGMVSQRGPLASQVAAALRLSFEKFTGSSFERSAYAVSIANGAVAEFFAENRQFLERLIEDKIYAEQSYGSFGLDVQRILDSNR